MHAATQPTMDDARRFVAFEHLKELGTSVRLERLPRVVRERRGIARPRRLIDLDHDPRNVVITGDLPEPTARAPVRASVPTEVRADLPSHELRLRKCLRGFQGSRSETMRDGTQTRGDSSASEALSRPLWAP